MAADWTSRDRLDVERLRRHLEYSGDHDPGDRWSHPAARSYHGDAWQLVAGHEPPGRATRPQRGLSQSLMTPTRIRITTTITMTPMMPMPPPL
jgi:hypothetical protein